MSVLVAVTDHAEERFRQRVGGSLEAKTQIASRVANAYGAGRWVEEGTTVQVRDLVDRDVVFVCRRTTPGELLVITLWEEERLGPPRVPKRFTDALRDRG
jgi:hypothetical protein